METVVVVIPWEFDHSPTERRRAIFRLTCWVDPDEPKTRDCDGSGPSIEIMDVMVDRVERWGLYAGLGKGERRPDATDLDPSIAIEYRRWFELRMQLESEEFGNEIRADVAKQIEEGKALRRTPRG